MQRRHGSTLVTFSLFSFVLMGATALAIDVGMNTFTRTRMQAAADAAALAGAQSLTVSETLARNMAKAISLQHGYALADSDITFPSPTTIRVGWTSPVSSTFAHVLGITQFQVPVDATAQLKPMTLGGDLRPWGIPLQDFLNYQIGTTYTIKMGSHSDGYTGGGNYYSLGLDGGGARTYRETVIQGSRSRFKIGDMVATETGNMVGPTTQGLNKLVGQDPYLSYDAALSAGVTHSPRVVTVVLVDAAGLGNGHHEIEIKGFASFYVSQWSDTGEVSGQFIDYATPNGQSQGQNVPNGTQVVALVD